MYRDSTGKALEVNWGELQILKDTAHGEKSNLIVIFREQLCVVQPGKCTMWSGGSGVWEGGRKEFPRNGLGKQLYLLMTFQFFTMLCSFQSLSHLIFHWPSSHTWEDGGG